LEVPPTIGFYQKNFTLCNSVRKRILHSVFEKYHLLGLLDRLHVLNFRWLSPELSTGPEMIRLAKQFVQSGHQLLNVSFHSSSLMPGKGPFVNNQPQLLDFMSRIEIFLKFSTKEGFTFSPLRDAVHIV